MFIKIRCLVCGPGQLNKIWKRSQIHLFKWIVQNGESLRPSLNE